MCLLRHKVLVELVMVKGYNLYRGLVSVMPTVRVDAALGYQEILGLVNVQAALQQINEGRLAADSDFRKCAKGGNSNC